MKKIGVLLCFLLALSLLTISCSKDIPEGGDVSTGTGSPVTTGPTGPTGG